MAVEIIKDNSYRIIVLGEADRIVYPEDKVSSLMAEVAAALEAVEDVEAPTEKPKRKRGRPRKKETENADSQ